MTLVAWKNRTDKKYFLFLFPEPNRFLSDGLFSKYTRTHTYFVMSVTLREGGKGHTYIVKNAVLDWSNTFQKQIIPSRTIGHCCVLLIFNKRIEARTLGRPYCDVVSFIVWSFPRRSPTPSVVPTLFKTVDFRRLEVLTIFETPILPTPTLLTLTCTEVICFLQTLWLLLWDQ